jgi:adenylate cyclase
MERAYFPSAMTPLRTTVLMKTDIAGSTPSFRALLAADLQALQIEHREFVARHAAALGGHIVKPTGDGLWLEFPSVTAAAKSAIAIQEALSLATPSKGGGRLSIRIVIGLGDVAVLDGDVIGDVTALIVRIEDITPANEIYITFAARLALVPAEVQTALVDAFSLKGFDEPIPVYRVEQRHRTRVIPNAYILLSDLRGFTRFTEAEPVVAIEHVLNTLDTLTYGVAHEHEGTVRYSVGDSYCLTFSEASLLVAAAERLYAGWEVASLEGRFDCAINIALHRGKICAFRSFLYGEGIMVAARVQDASVEVLADRRGGVFVTSAVRDDLAGTQWQSRLQPVAVKPRDTRLSGMEICRLMTGADRGSGRYAGREDCADCSGLSLGDDKHAGDDSRAQ